MPLRETKTIKDKQTEIADDALIEQPGTRVAGAKCRRTWLAILLGVLAIPVGLTLIGALTSPPHVSGVPSGHLITLQADAPSEHTTTLRGLFVSGPDGAARLLTHETEPQDADDGVREWITQPVLSPDGTQLAFEKQLITLQEDKQSIDNQVWVMRVTPDTRNPPHLVIDLTKQKLKQIVGLAWDSDSSLMFLQDGASYSVPTETDDAPLITPLDLHGLTLAKTGDVSATRSPALTEAGTFAYGVQTPAGPQVLTQVQEQTQPGPCRPPSSPSRQTGTKSHSCRRARRTSSGCTTLPPALTARTSPCAGAGPCSAGAKLRPCAGHPTAPSLRSPSASRPSPKTKSSS